MRAIVLHNPSAGTGDITAEDLLAALAAGGIEARYRSTEQRGFRDALAQPADLVLVDGGAGTVVEVIGHLRDRGLPIALVPLGGANNIARSLASRPIRSDGADPRAGAGRGDADQADRDRHPYARHAESYLDREPTNPPPNYAPEIVARAILHAATQPVRELNVGGSGRLLELLDHWLPGLTDRVMAAVLPRLEHGAELPAPRAPSGLHAPAGGARERSGRHTFVREHSLYTEAAMRLLACLAVASAVGAALVLISRTARSR